MEAKDGRRCTVTFEPNGEKTNVTTIFEPEQINTTELQQQGWQAILDNFKIYTENY